MATYNDIVNDIKKRDYKKLYLLTGEEPYYIDSLARLFEAKVIPEEEKDFNFFLHYGDKAKLSDVVDDARSFPMMGNRQLVVLREAQLMKDIEAIEKYLEVMPESTILLICYKKKADKRRSLFAKAQKQYVLFESQKLPDYKLPDFILSTARAKQLEINQQAANLLADFLGNDLDKIVNEIEKLNIAIGKGARVINEDLIELNIGASKDYNNFELLRAIVNRDTGRAYKIARYFAANEKQHPLQATLPILFNYFSNLMIVIYLPQKSRAAIKDALGLRQDFQVRDYETGLRYYSARNVFDLIRQIRLSDAKSKGVGNTQASGGDLLLDLLYHIFSR